MVSMLQRVEIPAVVSPLQQHIHLLRKAQLKLPRDLQHATIIVQDFKHIVVHPVVARSRPKRLEAAVHKKVLIVKNIVSHPGRKRSLLRKITRYPRKKAHRSEEHTSELQSRPHLVCRLLLEKKNSHL